MKLKYYKDDDILVMNLSQSTIDYAEESNGVVVHFDEKDRPVRVEVLDARRFLKEESRVLPEEMKEEYFAVA